VKITISKGIGSGRTSLAAFDAALLAAGVENYNLIRLSSVIPPDTVVERAPFRSSLEEYGHRLYVVMAYQGAEEKGAEAWAGLGWTQEEGDGRGLFVEREGAGEAAVREDLETTLYSMMESRGRTYGPIDCEIAGVRCEGEPVCALVIAVYKSEGWN